MGKADLHTHSYFSDGEHSPEELVRKAKRAGLLTIALTDHNSTAGIQRARREGKKQGVHVITGCEVMGREGEVLAYFIDEKNKAFQTFLERTKYYTQEMAKRRTDALEKMGVAVSWKEIQARDPQAKDNYNTGHLIGLLHDKGLSIGEHLRLAKQSVKETSIKDVSVTRVIQAIRKAGGVAVLAHPWLNQEVLVAENMERYVRAGLTGIEYENGDENRFGRTRRILTLIKKYAKQYQLILTQGSDFHGKTIQELSQGHFLGKTYCDETVVSALKEKAQHIKTKQKK